MTVPQPSRGQDDPQPFTHRVVPNAGLYRDLLLTSAHRWQATAAAATERAAEARETAGSAATMCEELLATAGTAVRELRQRLTGAPATGRVRGHCGLLRVAVPSLEIPAQQCLVRIEEELTLDTLLADLSA